MTVVGMALEDVPNMIAGVGDVNSDGFDDFAVTSPHFEEVAIVFGRPEGDCNLNAIPDGCDLVSGTSTDCDVNGVPDACDPDCNGNFVADACDIAAGTSNDCNADGRPDECDSLLHDQSDCNNNGVLDQCDVAFGTSMDCNNNQQPDDCDILFWIMFDCQLNGIGDECEIAAGSSEDCDGNGRPDECDFGGRDCNSDGILDVCDSASGVPDCNGNQTPDHCEPDCDGDGVLDECEFAAGTSSDCNTDGVPDQCQLGENDCNANGTPDDCDLAAGTDEDCNANQIPDNCDPDCDGSGLPDDCDPYRSGPALFLDGIDDYVDTGSAINPTGQMTIEAWILIESTDGVQRIVTKRLPQPLEGFSLFQQDGRLSFQIFRVLRTDTPDIAIVPGVWTHVAITIDTNQTIRLFVNGIQAMEVTGPIIQLAPTSGDVFLGASPPDGDESMRGLLDEIRIWSVARDEAAIRATMNQPLDGEEPGLLAYWMLNEGGGTVAVDQTQSYDGAIFGSPAWSPVAIDCDGDGVADRCEVSDGTAVDQNANLVPDHCEPMSLFSINDYGSLADCALGPVPESDLNCDCYDFDGSGAVDLLDFAVLTRMTMPEWRIPLGCCHAIGKSNGDQNMLLLESCATGPDGPIAHGCECLDLDGSGAVDLRDYARLMEMP